MIRDPLVATPETIRADARERTTTEAEIRYARTGLTIDAERAVEARHTALGYVTRDECDQSPCHYPKAHRHDEIRIESAWRRRAREGNGLVKDLTDHADV